MSSYLVKWKGETTGPHGLEQIKSKYANKEIGPMHEVMVDGQWMTLRSFLRKTSLNEGKGAGVVPPPLAGAGSADLGGAVRPEPAAQANEGASPPTWPQAIPSQYDRQAPLYVAAGFWLRATAACLDLLLLLAAPLWLIDFITGSTWLTLETLRGLPVGQWVIGLSLATAGAWLYHGIFESSPLRGTPGKACVGLVTGNPDASPLSLGQAFRRFGYKLISMLTLLIGFFLIAVTPDKLSLHDRLSRTRVLQEVPRELILNLP